VKKSHARIASAWERRNCGQVGADRRGAGSIPAFFRISHTVEAASFTLRPASTPWILRYPFGVLAGQPEDQGLDAPRRPAGLAADGLSGPAVGDDVAVPAQDGVQGDRQPQSVAPRFGYHAEQGREQGAVRTVQFRVARLLPLQYGELVAQDQDLCDLPRLLTLDSRSQEATRVIRRKTNRRHMIGDHHGRTAGMATLLVRSVDVVLGTHNTADHLPQRPHGIYRPRSQE
jgi:hypothetical protein